ncbi:MAG: radical SAM family heme chaperone HemW [Lachnospiraceae bacterium]|nr:radical SAM family heme chaperone HemW [Lachnospiraceae bacterium]
MELYVHIPFCVRKCLYCDFLSFAAGDDLKERYINALIKELGSFSGLLKAVPVFDTVFIGGGTPSLLDMKNTEKLLAAIKPALSENAEFTVECNPGTLDPEKLSLYREYGVNRLSIGLQSANDKELEYIGRIHRFEDFQRSYENARSAGFDNINIDLMSGLPGQNVSDFENTLVTVAKLAPEHISAYSLIIEPGTRFFEIYGENSACTEEVHVCDEVRNNQDNGNQNSHDNEKSNCLNDEKREMRKTAGDILPLPSEDEERKMYHITKQILKDYGYIRYEISNYSKQGLECRHNLGYWKGEEYLGAGIGAASYFKNERYKNTDDINRYIQYAEKNDWKSLGTLRTETEVIGFEESVEEYIILRLRLIEGFSKEDFAHRFGFSVMDKYLDVIKKHLNNGLLTDIDGRLALTERGLDLSNSVMSDFLK